MQMDYSEYLSVCDHPQVEWNYSLDLAAKENASSNRHHKKQEGRKQWESPNILLPSKVRPQIGWWVSQGALGDIAPPLFVATHIWAARLLVFFFLFFLISLFFFK